MSEAWLEASSLEIRRGDRTLLETTSWSWSDTRIGLIGANGSGKSSLLQVLSGWLKPSGGSLSVDGTDAQQAALGLVPDSRFGAPRNRRVTELVTHAARVAGIDGRSATDRMQQALDAVGLADARQRPFHLLSDGMRQRARIACALAQGHHTLLLDEPFHGLDADATRALTELLSQLTEAGYRWVITSHLAAPLISLDATLWHLSEAKLAPLDQTASQRSFQAQFADTERAWHDLNDAGWQPTRVLEHLRFVPPASSAEQLSAVLAELSKLGHLPLELSRVA